jgi:hypothetical protein
MARGFTSRGEDVGCASLLAVAVALLACTVFADGDLGFHLATGREVLASGRIPSTNVLSFTNPDAPWLLHQWLPGVLFELASRAGGVWLLELFKIALLIATWLVVYAGARITGAGPVAAALGSLLGAGAAAFRYELRPYLFTHLGLAVSITAAAAQLRAAQAGDERGARRALAVLVLSPVISCHLHAGVIDSWLVMVALAAAVLLEPFRARLFGSAPLAPSGARPALRIGAALLASIALAALTLSLYHPVGMPILYVPFDMAGDSYLAEHLVEFRPPYAFPFSLLAPYWILLAATLAALAAGLATRHLFWPFVVLGFALLSVKHARLAFGFALAASPLLAAAIAPWLEARRRALAPALLAVALPIVVGAHHLQAESGFGFSARTWPPYLFDYLARHQLFGHTYASDAWAAPLLGRFYPRYRAFFDNRFDAYPRTFFLDVYQRIRYAEEGWDALLDRHDVQLVLMRYTTPGEARFQEGKPNLRQRLVSDPRWALVTFDDQGELFARRAGQHAAHAERHAIAGLDPDAARFLSRPRLSLDRLRAEVLRNPSARVRVFAAFAALDAGDRRLALALAAQASAMEAAAPFLPKLEAALLSPSRSP